MEGKAQMEKGNRGCGSGRWCGIGMAEEAQKRKMVSEMGLGNGIWGWRRKADEEWVMKWKPWIEFFKKILG